MISQKSEKLQLKPRQLTKLHIHSFSTFVPLRRIFLEGLLELASNPLPLPTDEYTADPSPGKMSSKEITLGPSCVIVSEFSGVKFDPSTSLD